jgi:basic membrane protein A
MRSLLLAFFLPALLTGCLWGAHSPAQTHDSKNLFKVGIVFDKGGKDDKSFNNSAYRGAMKAKEDLGVFVKYIEATDDSAYEGAMRAFAHKHFDLIIAIGVSQAEAIEKVSKAFPGERFAIVDSQVESANVRSLLFQEHEGCYLVGAAAALASHTEKLGFIGGMDIPLIRRFEMGFIAGAHKINPQTEVLTNFIGVTSEAWNNPAKAKELALEQYGSGVDVIFAAAGASNAGLFDAAEEAQKLAIGVDSNQDWVKPGLVLTSMLKRVDLAVYATIKDAKEGHFSGGTRRFGLVDGGVDYSADAFNEKVLTPAMKKRLEELKAEIVSGKIVVPDFYKKTSGGAT